MGPGPPVSSAGGGGEKMAAWRSLGSAEATSVSVAAVEGGGGGVAGAEGGGAAVHLSRAARFCDWTVPERDK